MEKKYCFVILTFKPHLKNLKKLFYALEGFRIYLVDNHSGLITDKLLSEIKSDLKYIHNSNNLGFSEGMNKGLKKAYDDGYEWITIINDDIYTSHNSIMKYIGMLEGIKPGLAGLSPMYLDKIRYTTANKPQYINQKPAYLSASFLSIHKNVITKIGGLNNEYFMYYEDAEYCLKAVNSCFEICTINISDFKHMESHTIGKNSFLHQYYLARNHLLFVRRNAPLKVLFFELIRMPKTLFEHYKRREIGALYGIMDFALGRFGPYKGGL